MNKRKPNILLAIVCVFKGHNVCPDESIVSEYMQDKRNWLCKCHRCGLYEMHDGAIMNDSITLTQRGAMEVKRYFIQDTMEFKRRLEMIFDDEEST